MYLQEKEEWKGEWKIKEWEEEGSEEKKEGKEKGERRKEGGEEEGGMEKEGGKEEKVLVDCKNGARGRPGPFIIWMSIATCR